MMSTVLAVTSPLVLLFLTPVWELIRFCSDRMSYCVCVVRSAYILKYLGVYMICFLTASSFPLPSGLNPFVSTSWVPHRHVHSVCMYIDHIAAKVPIVS